jgi:hypothetical protein
VNRDDDCEDGRAMASLCNWTDEEKQRVVFGGVENELAQSLLLSLLAAHPTDRPKGMSEVLEHPFFTGGGGGGGSSGDAVIDERKLRAEIRASLEKEMSDRVAKLEKSLASASEADKAALEHQMKELEKEKQELASAKSEMQQQKTGADSSSSKIEEMLKAQMGAMLKMQVGPSPLPLPPPIF